ncbi:ABC-type metal ion transport system, periplasmic component/surface adhesin [Leptothrix cholodnii SP-6]|uniref:ABC-type metal ion transport system, periplasmic component/surface adhesin n=1 Tax=Leptothrix cholodnii (strain ATCC 51168 / LMG 8142 / SP-6) TaxID=395495 RepID=B1Y4B2_LEPCP|nr:DUF2796 domain-containing protein [Leptothrix cholodnii]ACB35813.1 ABC-type metal ion transport system, periplasmic component/surface adhesin [Leptothrix cholodnii SP-6]
MTHASVSPHRTSDRLRNCVLATVLGLAAWQAHAATGGHQHGALTLDIAIDGPTLAIEMEAPLDSLLGFEHAPRTAAQKQAAQALLARLRQPDGLFVPDAAAACTLKSASADSAALAPDTKAGGHADHADLDARYEWTCGNAAALRSVDLGGLLDGYQRIQTVDAQIASPTGQFKQRLKRPQKVLRWGK